MGILYIWVLKLFNMRVSTFVLCLLWLSIQGLAQRSLDSGLVVHYPMDGNVDDSTQAFSPLVLDGSSAFDRGMKGQSLLFNGANQTLRVAASADLPNIGFDTMSAFTVSLWAKPGTISSGGEGLFFAGNHHAGWVGIAVFWNNLRYSVGAKLDDTPKPLAFTYKSTYRNQWNLYTLCFEQDTMYAYLNDSLLGKKYQKVALGSPESMLATHQFGLPVRDQVRSQRFSGALDDLRIYSRCLSQQEVGSLFNFTYTQRREIQSPKSELGAYPNPSQGLFKLTLPSAGKAVQLTLFNSAGQPLQVLRTGNKELWLDLSAYPAGLYIAQVQGEAGIHQLKLIHRP